MRRGIDISQWQGNINFDQVKSQIDFVVIRCGYGSTIDPKFIQNVGGFKRVGVPITGVYHFIYALNAEEARQNARNAVAFCKQAGLPKSTIIWADLEYDTIDQAKAVGVYLGPNEVNLFTNAFCEEILKAGYKTGVYTNKDFINRFYSEATLKKYPIWYAIYDGKTTTDYPCMMKQWSCRGSFAGIDGDVDCNIEFESLPEEPTIKPTKTLNKVTCEVIDGKHGSGDERIESVRKEGYDPDVVQNRVNEYFAIAEKWKEDCKGYSPSYVYKCLKAIIN